MREIVMNSLAEALFSFRDYIVVYGNADVYGVLSFILIFDIPEKVGRLPGMRSLST
jgi:hypothetical protein